MKHLRTAVILSLVGITGALSAEVDHKKAGDAVPDVQLRKADGSSISLHDAVAEQPAVVVFYRGGWCPFCSAHLAELGRVEEQLRDLGFQILAVSPDRPEKLRESIDQVAALAPDRETTYTLLSDSKMTAAKAFGIAFQVDAGLVKTYRDSHGIDLEDASGGTHHLLPHPAVFIVTSDKIIRFVHVDTDYKKRLSGAEIMAAAQEAK
jgi:peroxiredoxin